MGRDIEKKRMKGWDGGWKKLDGWKQETSSIGKMTLAVGIPSSSIIILPRFPSDERKEDGVGWGGDWKVTKITGDGDP